MASSTSCNGSGHLYDCNGTTRPEQGDPTIACTPFGAVGLASDGLTVQVSYCCTPFKSTSCKSDSTVQSCQDTALYGFSCAGKATPKADAPSLNCTTGAAGPNGTTQYCCTDG